MNKVQTINLKGNEYATVPQRLKEFRSRNPRASITTKPVFQENGTLMFEATIVVDQADENSARATGHSYGEAAKSDKAFEKLETVSIGRSLAVLGYLNNGQIATTEEMVEFEEYQQDQFQLALDEIKNATKRDEFQQILAKLKPEQQKLATPVIQDRIKELKEQANADTDKS